MSNPADVPLLTAEDADRAWKFVIAAMRDVGLTLPMEREMPTALRAIAEKRAITKSAAAEEADRARIERLSAALERLCEYADASDDACYGTLATDLVRNIARQALSGASENG